MVTGAGRPVYVGGKPDRADSVSRISVRLAGNMRRAVEDLDSVPAVATNEERPRVSAPLKTREVEDCGQQGSRKRRPAGE